MQDMGRSTLSRKPRWTVPGNFHAPMVVYNEEQEERIFSHKDAHLRCIEVHSQTLIQLERGFTATGQTCVTIVGPLRARQWLMDMICNGGSPDSCTRARGGSPCGTVTGQ
ncbi:KH homology domain-containing protein 1-like [Oryctolagus cuniculus]|uniref:KH homology domain-containing protein 1-like n=1 Tax=Oryctolagus cuniculus TaxID=9986 RepID=UPI00222E99A5|nr:KH homology domain-containing protein 1-like [Oryctolagus cuniculus]